MRRFFGPALILSIALLRVASPTMAPAAEKKGAVESATSDSKDESASQIYLISTNGGEAVRVTQGEEDVHSFSWSADSQKIYFATRQPWSKAQKDDYKQQWKDVV